MHHILTLEPLMPYIYSEPSDQDNEDIADVTLTSFKKFRSVLVH